MISFVCCVLVAERCVLGGVTEAAHDLLGPRTGGGCQSASDVAQIMEVQIGQSDRATGPVPFLLLYARTDRTTLLANKDDRVGVRGHPER